MTVHLHKAEFDFDKPVCRLLMLHDALARTASLAKVIENKDAKAWREHATGWKVSAPHMGTYRELVVERLYGREFRMIELTGMVLRAKSGEKGADILEREEPDLASDVAAVIVMDIVRELIRLTADGKVDDAMLKLELMPQAYAVGYELLSRRRTQWGVSEDDMKRWLKENEQATLAVTTSDEEKDRQN